LKKTTHLTSGEPRIPLHSVLSETGKRNSGSVSSFLCHLPLGGVSAGDSLQLESQWAFGTLRTFRFPFPEGTG